jgi:two-component system, OmpR family, phosphate regulon sensor histidine kinase PhoR
MRLRALLLAALLINGAITLAAAVVGLLWSGAPAHPLRLLFGCALGAAGGAAGALLLSRRLAAAIQRPLLELRSAAEAAVAGDLRPARAMAFEESSAAIAAFNTMVDHLAIQVAELQLDKNSLESVLTHMSDALLILDPTGAVAMINPAAERIFGIIAAETLGRHPIEVIHHFELDALVRRAEGERIPVSAEIDVHHPDRRALRVQANPVIGRQAAFLGTVVVAQDITDLRRTDLIRQEFVANVSHELRTPLASLRALAETLQDGARHDPDAGPRFLAHMIAEIDRLTLLVSDLLDLSAIESGSAPLRMGSVSVDDVVQDVVAKFQLVADRRDITLGVDAAEDIAPMWADETRIEQALANLVDNAMKYTADGGSITVRGREREGFIALSVADTGAGIPAEHLSRIFERFYRVDRSRSRALGGTGLGLSIVKHIVTSHGGRVEVQSTEGRGSTFTLLVPRAPAVAPNVAAALS